MQQCWQCSLLSPENTAVHSAASAGAKQCVARASRKSQASSLENSRAAGIQAQPGSQAQWAQAQPASQAASQAGLCVKLEKRLRKSPA